MCEEVSAHEAGEAGLEPVHGEGGGVVERMHGDEDWAGGQLVLPAGQPVHGGEGVTLAQPVSVNFLVQQPLRCGDVAVDIATTTTAWGAAPPLQCLPGPD